MEEAKRKTLEKHGKRRVSPIPSLKDNMGDTLVVEVESFGRKKHVPLLDKYRGHDIVMAGEDVSTWDPVNKTLFRVGLDDSKRTGERFIDEKANNIETAKKYIDWKLDKGGQSPSEQAKKYKTAEEFVEKLPTVFRGTIKDSGKFRAKGIGVHFGTKEQASFVAKAKGGEKGVIKEVFLDIKNPVRLEDRNAWGKNAILQQLKEKGIVSEEEFNHFIYGKGADTFDVREVLKSKGYDGIVYANKAEGKGDSFITFSNEQIKTKSQLTDIWTKAQEKPKLPSPEKLRQSIIAGRNIKGMPRAELRDITNRITGHYSLSHKDITPEQLDQILTEVKATRPRRIQGKVTIKKQTEDRIQELKTNLINKGEMTEGVYTNILGSMNIKEPRYVSKTNFITESQGKKVIKNMLNVVPIIKDQVAIEKALIKQPSIGKEISDINTGFENKYKGQPAKVSSLLDMHHYADSMEKQTGIPFGRQQEEINEKRLLLDNTVIEPKLKEITIVPEYKKIIKDEVALRRINDYVASQLPSYVKGKPTSPAGITDSERQIAETISTSLKAFENDVRYNRFYEWYDHNTPIPNAPEIELERATEILETHGDNALRKWLNTRSWGVIRSGYDIGEVVKPSIKTFQPKPGVPKGHLKARESINFNRYERDIISRYFSYVRQMTYKTELAPEIKALQTMWSNNSDLFNEPVKIADNLSRYLKEVLGKSETRGPLEDFVFTLWSQASRAIFLDARKGVRNLFQNLAFYSSPEDFFRMKPLAPDDLAYFKTFVSQNKGIRRDLQMLDYKGVAGFRHLNELADAINVMGRTDELNRFVGFSSKLNAVKDAVRLYPDYTTNEESLRNLQIRAGFGDMEIMERKHALEKLAVDGPDAMARYVAKAVTQKVHFLYERAQRSPAEQGSTFRTVFSNLLTFKKGFIQRQILDAKKLFPSEMRIGSDIKSGRRSMRSLIGSLVLAGFVGALYKKLTGDKRNPYRADEIVKGIGIGGLATGTQDQINDFTRDVMSAVKGDRTALGRVIVGMTRLSDTFVPFYDEVINTFETLSDTYNLDKAVLRQIRGEFDKRYTPKKLGYYKARRDFSEKLQHTLFGTDKAKSEKKVSGSFNYLEDNKGSGVSGSFDFLN